MGPNTNVLDKQVEKSSPNQSVLSSSRRRARDYEFAEILCRLYFELALFAPGEAPETSCLLVSYRPLAHLKRGTTGGSIIVPRLQSA
jgi:hypothetical protein